MSTTYYQLFNGKRRLITLILIILTLVAFLLPFVDVVYAGESVSKVTGFEMLFGQKGHTLIKEMGLDMGLTRKELADMSVNLGFIVMPLLSVIIPIAAMLLAIYFIRQNTRGAAVLTAVMMLVSLVFYHFQMNGLDDKRLITMRVVKRYVQQYADEAKMFIANEKPKLETLSTQAEKDALQAQLDAKQKNFDVLSKYNDFLKSTVKNYEFVQIFTDIQDKAKQTESAQIEDEHDAALKFNFSQTMGMNTVDIVKILMLLTLLSAAAAAIGKYRAASI